MINSIHIVRFIQGIGSIRCSVDYYCKHHLYNTIILHSILKFAGQNYKYCQRASRVWVKKGNYLTLNSSFL